MAHRRVTIQDIADACGLSRNTVSKVFNDRGSVPEATRKVVLNKAQELGYYQLPEGSVVAGASAQPRSIALLTGSDPMSHSFGSLVITSFTDQISRAGYTLKIYRVSGEETANRSLPPHLLLKETAGIIAIELFDREYSDMLCRIGLPIVLVDSYSDSLADPIQCDLVFMENYTSAWHLTRQMIRCGAREIGFVGDINHCRSFHERWDAYRLALDEAGLPLSRSYSILAKDSEPYGNPEWLAEQLRNMPHIPDAFLCANDYIAIHLMTALKKMGLSIPDDVMVAGFDGSPESAVVEPSLTTAEIPSAEIGRLAAETLLGRIQNPDRAFRITYVKTAPVFRNSTR